MKNNVKSWHEILINFEGVYFVQKGLQNSKNVFHVVVLWPFVDNGNEMNKEL